MKAKSIIAGIALLFIGIIVNAQNQITSEQLMFQFEKDTMAIEQKCTQVLDNAISDSEMIGAVNDLKEGYESLMTKYYNLLLSKIKPEDKDILTQSQKDWLRYRENEIAVANKIYYEYDGFGSMGRLSVTSHNQELVKSRVIQLYQYLYTLLEY